MITHSAPRTLYDRLWDAHTVVRGEAGKDLIYIDRHLLHEVSTPQSFELLRDNGLAVRRPVSQLAVPDHAVPTSERGGTIKGELARKQVALLEANCQEFGIEYLALEGGGGKGITYLGAIRALEELGVLPIRLDRRGSNQIKGISGSSAGAITALLLAMGIRSEEFQNLLKDASTFRKFYDGPDIGRHRYVNARNESGVRAEPAGRGRPPVSLIKERLDSLQTSAIQRDLGLDVS